MNGKLIATLGVAAATFVIAACGDDGGNGDAEENGGAEEISAAAPDPTELEGTWSTEPVTAADLAETVRAAGLGEHVDAFLQNAPISDSPTSLVLKVGGGWDLSGQVGERPREPIDYDADYYTEGDTVVVRHGDGNTNTLRWSVNGDVLELTWLEGTHPAFQGIPDEAYQRALYMTADFRRQG
jgi:hypothetical protein